MTRPTKTSRQNGDGFWKRLETLTQILKALSAKVAMRKGR